jgi:3-oxoacyl-[acyl-carrier-protein] synthase III
MAGILSIGWYVPAGRRDRDSIAQTYGIASSALEQFGLMCHTVAAEGDHPSTMAAHAVRAALSAGDLTEKDIDLLIFSGLTRDYPAPWVAAFGVLHELGAVQAAGFDLSNRCPAVSDAIWLASTLVRAGSHENVVVCAGDRYDYLIGPPRKIEQVSDAAFSAGAGAVVVTRSARNEIAAFAHLTNDDLSLHEQLCPKAGGTRHPLDVSAIEHDMHRMQSTMRVSQAARLKQYMQSVDRHNITAVCQKANFDEVDFVICAPLDAKAQLAILAEIGIGPEKTLFTVPQLGHMGGADTIVCLGLAVATGRQLGQRIVISTRSILYSNALAIRALDKAIDIRANGFGLNIEQWLMDERRWLASAMSASHQQALPKPSKN